MTILNILHKLTKVEGYPQQFMFWCIGCKTVHTINDGWDISGSDDKPTVHPSVKTTKGNIDYCCHLFLKNGTIRYLNDCTHDLKGQTVNCKKFKRVEWNDDAGKHNAYEPID